MYRRLDPTLDERQAAVAIWNASEQADGPAVRGAGERSPLDWATDWRLTFAGTEPVGLAAVAVREGSAAADARLALLPAGIDANSAAYGVVSRVNRRHLRLNRRHLRRNRRHLRWNRRQLTFARR